MRLTEREVDKLLLSVAAMVARDRKARGLKLNYPEAVAIIACGLIEKARDGESVATLMGMQGPRFTAFRHAGISIQRIPSRSA